MVRVPVVVRDRAGKAVGGLSKEDFQLFDKGKGQRVAQFSAGRERGAEAESRSAGGDGDL